MISFFALRFQSVFVRIHGLFSLSPSSMFTTQVDHCDGGSAVYINSKDSLD